MTLEEIALQIATAQVGTRGVHTTDVTAIEWRRHTPSRYGIRDVYAETEYVVEYVPGEHWERVPLNRWGGHFGIRFAHLTAQDAIAEALRAIQSPYEMGVKAPNFAPDEVV